MEYKDYSRENLKFLRLSRGISQSRLARALKVDSSTINKWESSDRKITLSQATKIANYFEVPLGDFISIDLKEKDKEKVLEIIDFSDFLLEVFAILDKVDMDQKDKDYIKHTLLMLQNKYK